jgi:glycerol-3-phosphate acyltransferase PlsX
MRLIVDAMSGDNAPQEIIKGCVEAAVEYGVHLTLVGDKEIVEKELRLLNAPTANFEIVHSSDIITMEDEPTKALRQKPEASMSIGLRLAKEDAGSVFISAGNTGALVTGGTLKRLGPGRLEGIDRPALAPFIPNRRNGSLLLDAGANADCKPLNLVQFAVMGSIYMEKVLGRSNPKVGLINIGTEETKGNELTKAAFALLKETRGINFIGNIEPREMPEGAADILVCDGFTGNVILKLTEGLATSLFGMLKEEMMKSISSKLGALLLKPGLRGFKRKLDYTEHGGAPLLGVNGGIIKAHGSSNARAMKNAIRQGKLYLENGVLSSIKNSIQSFKFMEDSHSCSKGANHLEQ